MSRQSAAEHGISRVYDEPTTQQEVFEGSASNLLDAAFAGYNATVFAYGATGCGKVCNQQTLTNVTTMRESDGASLQTHTISGTPEDPGIIFRLMQSVFDRIEAQREETTVEVTVSYLESVWFRSFHKHCPDLLLYRIYNETIRDLLTETQGKPLNLRESDQRVVVPGLSEHTPQSASEVLALINAGNLNRTTGSTDANATSSRSHAVLSVNLKMRARTADISESYSLATLSVIDLAGSERACVTNNKGARLHEGANINRSLLALGNCIKALCDPKSKMHVPFRDSKLTRLLKHSLTGNCRTQLIVCVSPSSQHYDETYNTLQYANKAKDIKTKVQRNVISVDRHVSQYVRLIHELRQEIEERKKDDSTKEAKIKAQDKRERELAMQQATASASQLAQHKNNVITRISGAAHAQAHLASLEELRQSLHQWHEACLQGQHFANTEVQLCIASVESTIREFDALIHKLKGASADLNDAKNYFNAQIRQARQRIHHDEARSTFERDCQVLKLELDVAEASGRERGRIQAFQMQSQMLGVVSDVRIRLSTHATTAFPRVEAATKELFGGRIQHLSLPVASTAPALGIPSAASSLRLSNVVPIQTEHTEANTKPTQRDQSASSPPQRKKQKKSVVWRDEAGDGMDLEEASEVPGQSAHEPAEGTSVAAPGPNLSFGTALGNLGSPPSLLQGPSPKTVMPHAPRPSIVKGSLKSRPSASSSQMRTGFLGQSRLSMIKDEESSPASSSGSSSLPSRLSAAASTSSTSTSGAATVPSISRHRTAPTTSADSSSGSINSSFDNSQVHHTRSSMLKAAHGRRMSTLSQNSRRSSIGPIKSFKQPPRRASQSTAASQTGGENKTPKLGLGLESSSVKKNGSGALRGPGRTSTAPQKKVGAP